MAAYVPEARPLRAVIYCRVSSDPTGQQLSVKSQERFCRDLAKTQGIEVVRVFVDNDIGASTYSLKDRPDFRAMVDWLTDGADVNILIAWTANRTTRNMREYLDLRDLCADRGLLYSYSGKTYDMRRVDDRFATGLDALLAERGADEIHTNVLLGKESAALAGRPAGRLLWGTIRRYDSHRAYIGTDTDPEIGRVLRWMFKVRWERMVPKYRIARILTRARIRTPQPPRLKLPKDMPKAEKKRLREEAWATHPWSAEVVHRILSNPAYAGLRVYQGKIIGPSDWEGVISPEAWQDIQDREEARAVGKNRDRTVKYLQTGSMECGECEVGRMTRGVNRNKLALVCKKCQRVSVLMEPADKAIVDLLMRRFAQPDCLELMRPQEDREKRSAAEVKHRQLVKRLEEIERLTLAGEFEPAFGARARRDLLPQIEEAAAAAKPPKPLPDWAVALAVPDPLPVWRRMPIETQRTVVRTMLRVVARKGRKNGPVMVPIQQRLKISWRELP